jgi:hypothetical protein
MIRYERSNEIDAGESGDDDVAVSGGVSARCSRFSRDGFGGLFVDKKHLARIERPSSFDRRVIFILTHRFCAINNLEVRHDVAC